MSSIFFLALIGLGLLALYIHRLPADLRVVRDTAISAPRDEIFAKVNDLKNWKEWSPWEKLDPDLIRRYEGAPSGTGAIYRWKGNRQVGAGCMTITESRPPELIRIRLEFIRPFKAVNQVEFRFEPEIDKFKVTWSMAGRKNFISKAFGLFMNMEEMISKDFDKGLQNLKIAAEPKLKPKMAARDSG